MKKYFLFYDSPIARTYLYFLNKENITFNNIIYLINKDFNFIPNKLARYLNFKKNNYHIFNFLNDKKYQNSIRQVSKYFKLNENIFNEIYQKDILSTYKKKIIYYNDENINNNKFKEILINLDGNIILFTGKIVVSKNILETNKKFIHIHPGYLPKVKGADALLWHIKKFNNFGVSMFVLNANIDDGKVYAKEEKEKIEIFDNYLYSQSIKTKYRFFYGFIDPIVRTFHLLNNFNKIYEEDYIIKNLEEKSNYFSYMDDNDLQIVFDVIFKKHE